MTTRDDRGALATLRRELDALREALRYHHPDSVHGRAYLEEEIRDHERAVEILERHRY